MKHIDRLKDKTTLVCKSAVVALAAMMVGVTTIVAMPQEAAAQSLPEQNPFPHLKNCHGVLFNIVGDYNETVTGKTVMFRLVAVDSEGLNRHNHEIKIEHKRGDDWVEVLDREDLPLSTAPYPIPFNKSPDGEGVGVGVVVSDPPTEIRFEVKADKPGRDYTCTGTRRVLL